MVRSWPKKNKKEGGDQGQGNSRTQDEKHAQERFSQVVRAESPSVQVPLPLQTLKKRNPRKKDLCMHPFLARIKLEIISVRCQDVTEQIGGRLSFSFFLQRRLNL
jgi:hypothetical protein